MSEIDLKSIVLLACLLLVSLIHIAPLYAVLGGKVLNQFYQIQLYDSNLELLMRHRAILFGILGGIVMSSIFYKDFQWLAIIIALVSTISFIVLAHGLDVNPAIQKVIKIDWIAIVLLLLACLLKLRSN